LQRIFACVALLLRDRQQFRQTQQIQQLVNMVRWADQYDLAFVAAGFAVRVDQHSGANGGHVLHVFQIQVDVVTAGIERVGDGALQLFIRVRVDAAAEAQFYGGQ